MDLAIEPAGYKVLIEMGMQDLTFEDVIVRYPDAFNHEVVLHAVARLKELSDLSPPTVQRTTCSIKLL